MLELRPFTRALCVPVLLAASLGCATTRGGDSTEGPSAPGRQSADQARKFTVLSVNDTYRLSGIDTGTVGGFPRLRTLRRELESAGHEVLLLHAGDFLFPSLLSRKFGGAQLVDAMNHLDGDPLAFDERMLLVFGNHEFDNDEEKDAKDLDRRVFQSQFRWLGTNLRFKKGKDGKPMVGGKNLVDTYLLDIGGVKVGVYGLVTDSKPAEYIECFEDYTAAARRSIRQLRADGAEVVLGLTHITMGEDLAVLKALGKDRPDLVLGGHEHAAQTEKVDDTYVLKADADAVTATIAELTVAPDGSVTVQHRLARLGPDGPSSPAPDAAITRRIVEWNEAYDLMACIVDNGLPAGCLDRVIGKAGTKLDAEELLIRTIETNLGNWIADRMVETFADQGAQAAIINSGSLRLNQNLAAGTDVTRRHLEELFAYSAELRLLEIDGRTLQQAAAHSVESWTGNGWWAQVAGFAFWHDPDKEAVGGFNLLTEKGPRRLDPNEKILLVTTSFLAGGRDGYSMLDSQKEIAIGPDLEDVVANAFAAAGNSGIAPKVEGRICNKRSSGGPCLAQAFGKDPVVRTQSAKTSGAPRCAASSP